MEIKLQIKDIRTTSKENASLLSKYTKMPFLISISDMMLEVSFFEGSKGHQ